MSTITLKWFMVICLVLRIISNAQCVAQRSVKTENMNEDEEDTYDYTDDYDYTSSDNRSPQYLAVPEKNDPPYFDQTSIHVSTDPNNDVVLNCDVRNFHVNNVVIWYKDQTVYSNGKYSVNKRVETLVNNSIVLKNVQLEDAGNYYCEVFPENIRLHVILEVNKELTITCDGREVVGPTIIYREGESHVCECKTTGSNEQNIKWSLNGNRFDESIGELKHNSIILNSIEDYHHGIYQCLADDGSKQLKHGMFNMEILFSPKVTTHRHHINTEIGGTAELYCDYKGNPIATVSWIKNTQPIKYSEKFFISHAMEKHFNRSTLTVKDVAYDDLGEYLCQAENSIGSNKLRTHLMLEPEKGQLENVIIEGKNVKLYWIVRSMQSLSEAVLDYKTSGSYTWSTTTVLHTQRHENGIWKVSHEMELIQGEWQTRMKTKNTAGWSKFSAPFIFQIKDEGGGDTTNETSNEMIAMAGFGATRGSSTIIFAFSVQYILILALLSYIV